MQRYDDRHRRIKLKMMCVVVCMLCFLPFLAVWRSPHKFWFSDLNFKSGRRPHGRPRAESNERKGHHDMRKRKWTILKASVQWSRHHESFAQITNVIYCCVCAATCPLKSTTKNHQNRRRLAPVLIPETRETSWSAYGCNCLLFLSPQTGSMLVWKSLLGSKMPPKCLLFFQLSFSTYQWRIHP